jgi:hypothetical protein
MTKFPAYIAKYTLALAGLLSLIACEKVEDPFVDRVAAPVLVVIENAKQDYLAGGGLYGEPVVDWKADQPVVLSARIYTLDKTNILNHQMGIDSIPVTNLSVTLTTRTGVRIADLTSGTDGRVSVTKTWAELGLEPVKGNALSLDWAGEYQGQRFVRRSKLQVVE